MTMTPTPPGPLEPRARPEASRQAPSLIFFMFLAVAAVGLLAFWGEERESVAGLDDFAEEQAMLAGSMASELAAHLSVVRHGAQALADHDSEESKAAVAALEGYTHYAVRRADQAPIDPARGPADAVDEGVALHVPVSGRSVVDLVIPPAKLLEGAARMERPGAVRVLLLDLRSDDFHAIDGQVLRSAPIRAALASGLPSVWLGRDDAATLGLPHRRAAVGLAQIDAGVLGRWGIAVANSAERERDRDLRARWRLVLSVLAAAGLVFAFGSIALRKQRRGLVLESELAMTGLRRERDGKLATASRAATMGTLAMGIAHEVSTPLGIIVGRAEQLLPRISEDERSTRSLRAILAQAERIRRVVLGFLDLARGGTPSLGDVDPASVLEGAIALVEHRFAAAEVALTLDVAPDLPMIHCDVAMLEQALVNLLLNACDACKRHGHVAAMASTDGDRVAFTVVDDGGGITTENAARAAEPFFTTKPAGQGTGLGLAITSEIVKMHRGTLSIEPASPRGTRVSVIIPASHERSRDAL
jgi:two-component system, NtrC family, sensor kinase